LSVATNQRASAETLSLTVRSFLFFFFRLFPVETQPAKVTAHWHKGTTYMIKFDESVIARDKQLEGR